ncbi:hypothetical protein RJ641_017057 [Dillenia turbinata]|uniref:SWIM-type domain-containing protein n=1 Tax=Dillenia turbinata TaxID=194707 RepID=A0AAN8UN71_9MAGN
MARWDRILTLPRQNPPSLEFSSADLEWSKVEGWRDKINNVALIPFERVNDFVKGESSNKDCPTRFHVEARRKKSSDKPYKPKVDGVLEYILYWCSYGPDDHRKGGIVRPSRSTYVPKNKSAGRPNTKRWCTCHFIVKCLSAEPTLALLIYNHDKHVDTKGLPCHGIQDKKAEGTPARFAPGISDDLRLCVLSLLYAGVSVETIMQKHNESVKKRGGPTNRDDLLTHRYVRRQERKIRRSTYEWVADDAVSISKWVENHQNQVFFYQDFSESDPFTLGIQTEWQLQQMIQFGNHGLVASDSRFGTNKLKYPIHSLVVFNSHNNAIPVAWIITPRFSSGDAIRWMRALYDRVHTKDPKWKLAGFIVDDPFADVHAIREVFQCSILISFWRVRHAWHKNLVKKCSEAQTRAKMFRQLGQAVSDICTGQGTTDLFEDFMKDFIDSSDFIDYFKAVWYPRIGSWSSALKSLPLASQETCAAMEFYHYQLKVRLLNEKDSGVYSRADWLVHKLGTEVHSYFWLDEYPGRDDYARYWKDEWLSGLTSWRKALKIPDSDVILEGGCTKVITHFEQHNAHIVQNPDSVFAICDCSWSEMGNLCEHVVRAVKVCRDNGSAKPSISLLKYRQALESLLHCPPHDSLIRDYAVSLAVFIQTQLSSSLTVDSKSSRPSVVPIDGQAAGAVSPNPQRDSVNGGHKNISSYTERSVEDGSSTQGSMANDVGCEHVDQVASQNGFCSDTAGAELSCHEMDVDTSLICISPSPMLPLDRVVINDVLSGNEGRAPVNSDLDTCEDLHSKSVAFTDQLDKDDLQDGIRCAQMMDASTLESGKQCGIVQENNGCSHVTHAAAVLSNVVDVNSQFHRRTSSVPMPIEFEAVDMVEAAGFIKECEDNDMENVKEDGSVNRNPANCSPVSDGMQTINGNSLTVGHNGKMADNLMAACPES